MDRSWITDTHYSKGENMEKRDILVISTVPGFFVSFMIDLLKEATIRYGSISLCTNFNGTKSDKLIDFNQYEVSFTRNPLTISNLRAMSGLKKIINSKEFSLIHTQTPICSALVRLVNASMKVPLIYAAHGFHFHKNSSIMNWLFYFPVEWYLSRFTDVLITINKEDYALAKKWFKAKKTELVSGAGVDFGRFHHEFESHYLHSMLGLNNSTKIITSVGELNKNKNHVLIIDFLKSFPELKDVHFVICGEGAYRERLTFLIDKYSLSDRVHLIGHRKDIPQILASSNLFVFPSKREGLPVALLETLLSGLDFVAFNIRGITDLVPTEIHENHLAPAYNKKEFLKLVVNKIQHPQKFDYHKHMDWLNQFSVESVNERYLQIYEELLARDTNE
jgi:glycosyltransferase involved in cell wall biosynthesis